MSRSRVNSISYFPGFSHLFVSIRVNNVSHWHLNSSSPPSSGIKNSNSTEKRGYELDPERSRVRIWWTGKSEGDGGKGECGDVSSIRSGIIKAPVRGLMGRGEAEREAEVESTENNSLNTKRAVGVHLMKASGTELYRKDTEKEEDEEKEGTEKARRGPEPV
ncbi:uncharacterized protein SPSK_08066 [Sporothrix schenckii 1099-18]|uniref:Uncharacterized protein n=1 Tax=Sporothrix schenckii 1099-18 TaxID=1397361 RepID=A0A0F2MGH9_SPOSC|nr:uncharacterized protein SPSK_08066 [Sporothrix schenckii 1099-18]KJR88737.1 hypothetical protein SPSK_08066 [Sporothrix schenckii 1099-18]